MKAIPYEYALLIAIGAYTFSVLLTEGEMILSPVYKRLYAFFKTDERQDEGKPVHWLFKILMYCEKCVAGQWALWYFLYKEFNTYMYAFTFNLIALHLFFVLLTVFITYLISIVINKINN